MLVAQNSLGPVCPVPLTVRGTEHRAPIHGRYAGNTYPCQLGDAWWWSPGFGRDDCPEGGFFRRPARGDGVNGVR